MIGDAFQRFASAQAMTGAGNFASLGASTPFFYPFPQPGSLNISALDWLVAQDRGQGWPQIARLDVNTAFASTDATMLISLAIAASDANDGSATFTIARSLPTLVGAWPVGFYEELVLPKLPGSLATAGRRYLLLGFEITTAIAFGGALFTAGAFTAAFRVDTAPDLKLHPSGFTF